MDAIMEAYTLADNNHKGHPNLVVVTVMEIIILIFKGNKNKGNIFRRGIFMERNDGSEKRGPEISSVCTPRKVLAVEKSETETYAVITVVIVAFTNSSYDCMAPHYSVQNCREIRSKINTYEA